MANRALFVLFVLLSAQSALAAHPRTLMTGDTLTRLRAKETAGDADWLTLKGSAATPGSSCDRLSQTTAGTPDGLPPVYAAREPITSAPLGTISSGYQGDMFYHAGLNLAVCYYATAVSDPPAAAEYLAQAIKVLEAASSPFASVAPASPPATWKSRTSRLAHYVDDDGPAGQARVYLSLHGLQSGDAVTVSGVLGCTDANISGKVGFKSTHYFDLTTTGDTPVICSSPGTNYNQNPVSDAGYSYRNYGVLLALGYDWLHAELDATQKTNIFNSLNAFYDEFVIINSSSRYDSFPLSNYHAGYFAAVGLSGILTSGVGENPRGTELYDYWRDTLYELQDQPFFERWLGNNGGFPEAIRYQTRSAAGIVLTLLAQWDANAEDLFTDFPWVLDLMEYWIHNTMPPRDYLSYRGYIPYENPINPWDSTWPVMPLVHHVADLKSDAFQPKFKQWVDDLRGAGNPTTTYLWWPVIFWDSTASASAWTGEALSLAQMSNPAGGHSRVNMRSDWTTDAVYGDIWTSPQISSVWNGKERRDKGSIYVQRGDEHLLVSAVAEAARQNNSTAYSSFHSNSADDIYGFLRMTRDSDSANVRQNNAYYAPYPQPGFVGTYPTTIVTQHPTRVDRYEDATDYVYLRATEIEQVFGSDSVNALVFPVAGWTREILYVRPKVFVVYDRSERDNTIPYSHKMAWITGNTPTTSAYGSMIRTEVEDVAYKGGLTYVLPASLTTATTDLGGYGVANRIDVSPPSQQQYINWMTVVDAADAQGNLEAVASFATSSNIDVIRLGTDEVVGFPDHDADGFLTLPMTYTMAGVSGTVTHRIPGLAPSTTYNVSESGNDITIASTGGGSSVGSTAAGVLVFTSGSGGTPVVTVTTTSLPDGTVGVAYSETLAATGGDGGPYTWSVTVGSEPSNTTLSSGGVLSGTPDTAETANFTAQACDTAGPTCGTKPLSVTINTPTLTVTTVSVPNAVKDVAYSTTLSATGGATPYSWDVSAGALCTGLALSSAGVLSGTPTVEETCNFTARVTDDDSDTDTQALSVTVASSLLTLAVRAEPGSTGVVIHYGAHGLPQNTTCTVQVSEGESLEGEAESTSGAASRTAYVSGLVSLTQYGIMADCSEATPETVVSFITLPSEGTGTVLYSISIKPSALLVSPDRAYLEWENLSDGVTTGNQTFTSCSSGCTGTLSVTHGVTYRWRHTWQNSGATAISPPSKWRYYAVP